MIKETISINKSDKYRFDVYLQDESCEIVLSHLRPFMIVCPGGGYCYTSDREADPIAFAYLAEGFNVGVLRYSVGEDAAYPQASVDLSVAIRTVRENASKWHTDPQKVAICGFSAGGHLVAMQGVHWNDPEIMRLSGCESGENRPDAIVLGYPVISSGEWAHRGSIDTLLRKFIESGNEAEINRMLNFVSCEKNVGKHTPPAFLFHTCHDSAVPVMNSILFAEALAENKIDFEMHIFQDGEHGLAMCNRTTNTIDVNSAIWIKLSADWLWKHFE